MSYIFACVAVPIAWAAAVHFLFDAWHQRQAARHRVTANGVAEHDEEAEEPNVP